MTDSTSEQATKPKLRIKLIVWIVAILALLIGSFWGIKAFLVSSEVSNFQTAFEVGDFDGAREALDGLKQWDSGNALIQSGLTDIELAELEIRYLASLEVDDLDNARVLLDEILELDADNVKKFDDFDQSLNSVINSKRSYEAGISAFEDGDFARSIPLLKSVISEDGVRYEEAQSKVATASKKFASQVSNSMKKLVSKGFYVSAYLDLEDAVDVLGDGSKDLSVITDWFNEKFEKAKTNALKNEMAVRKDSFTGQVSYYYKPTYVTCCGGSLQAADRFRLVISGKSSPSLLFNVMLYQDDWVFAEEIKANIDGEMWTIATDSYFGDTIERDNANGSIWEYTYRKASSEDLRYVLSARQSKQTIIRFQGDQSRSDFTVTSRMKDGIEQVLLAYLALGGQLGK